MSSTSNKVTKVSEENKTLHKRRYNAPWGKRRCCVMLAPDCHKVADEALFKGRICLRCRKLQQSIWYHKRLDEQGSSDLSEKEKKKRALAKEEDDRILHKRRYNAPWGKRRCCAMLAPNCRKIADESLFKGRTCLRCRKVQLAVWYHERRDAMGIPKGKRGRPKLTEKEKKKRALEREEVKKPKKSGSIGGGKANKSKSCKI